MPRIVKKSKDLVAGQPQRPTNLSARAGAEWDRIVSELTVSGIKVTPAHRATLSQAATISADIAECCERVQMDGAVRIAQQERLFCVAQGPVGSRG